MGYESGNVYRVPLEEWYVVEPPVWEDHRRARNWLARIAPDPDVPGGFSREWCERGRGRFKYSATSMLEGDTIEFGADRIWGSGDGRSRCRWVGEIVDVHDTHLAVRYFKTPKEMFDVIADRESRLQEVPA
jgi:hypothetical protein